MAPFVQALINGLTDGAFLAMVALGITLIFGVARFPNVAHGDFLTVGAYGTLWTMSLFGLPLLVATIGGVVLAIVTGLLAYVLIFRRIGDRPVTALLASIGLSIFMRALITFVAGGQQQTFNPPLWRAWRFWDLRILPMEVLIFGASVAVILGAHIILRHTRIGMEMRAVSDNPDLARSAGIDPERVSRYTWGIALAVAGIGGVFLGVRTSIFPDMGWNFLLPAFAAAVLGGMGSPYGAILAGFILGIAQNLAIVWLDSTYRVAFAFIVLILVLLFKPSGLAGRKEMAR